jgi:hypothetical protein
MRGPNKPKPLPSPSQPATTGSHKARKRASTMPTALRSGPQMWVHHQKQQQQNRHQEHGIPAAASPASSVGSGSLGYPQLSESEASPMTPHRSLDRDSRQSQPTGVVFPQSPRAFMHDFSAATTQTDVGRIGESNDYDGDAANTGGVLTGVYGQDIFRAVRMSLDSTKTHF